MEARIKHHEPENEMLRFHVISGPGYSISYRHGGVVEARSSDYITNICIRCYSTISYTA
jgi:hypothetical protein